MADKSSSSSIKAPAATSTAKVSATTPAPKATKTTTTSSGLTPTPTQTQDNATGGSGGLSTAAIAGIGAAGGLLVLFLVAVLIGKRRRAARKLSEVEKYDPSRDPVSPLDNIPLNKYDHRTKDPNDNDSGFISYPLALRGDVSEEKIDSKAFHLASARQTALFSQEYQHYDDHIQSHFAPESPPLRPKASAQSLAPSPRSANFSHHPPPQQQQRGPLSPSAASFASTASSPSPTEAQICQASQSQQRQQQQQQQRSQQGQGRVTGPEPLLQQSQYSHQERQHPAPFASTFSSPSPSNPSSPIHSSFSQQSHLAQSLQLPSSHSQPNSQPPRNAEQTVVQIIGNEAILVPAVTNQRPPRNQGPPDQQYSNDFDDTQSLTQSELSLRSKNPYQTGNPSVGTPMGARSNLNPTLSHQYSDPSMTPRSTVSDFQQPHPQQQQQLYGRGHGNSFEDTSRYNSPSTGPLAVGPNSRPQQQQQMSPRINHSNGPPRQQQSPYMQHQQAYQNQGPPVNQRNYQSPPMGPSSPIRSPPLAAAQGSFARSQQQQQQQHMYQQGPSQQPMSPSSAFQEGPYGGRR